MKAIEQLCDIIQSYSGVADFVIIYIAEAHASDEWRFIGGKYSSTPQHKTLEDRMDAAIMLQSKNIPCPIYVDKMDNAASSLYAAIPERLYIINNGMVEYAGGCGLRLGPRGHNPNEVKEWLDDHFKKMNSKSNQKNGSISAAEACDS